MPRIDNDGVLVQPRTYTFVFSHGNVVLEMDREGNIHVFHHCAGQSGRPLNFFDENESAMDSLRERMKIKRFKQHLAKLHCWECGFDHFFKWLPPMSFDRLIEAIQEGSSRPNILSRSQ